MIAALAGLARGAFERQRLRTRVHALEGLLEIKLELETRLRSDLNASHARVRSLEAALEHFRERLPHLRSGDTEVVNELEGVVLEALLAA